MRPLLAVLCVLGASGCTALLGFGDVTFDSLDSSVDGGIDSGLERDAGMDAAIVRDSGARDSGPADSGTRDSGPRDTGIVDAFIDCYDRGPSEFARWHVPHAPASTPRTPRRYYISSLGDMVVDEVTGLRWERDGLSGALTAAAASDYCDTLELDFCTNWRVPTLMELASIVAVDVTPPPVIDATAFNGVSLSYWSSTLDPATSEATLGIDFQTGNLISTPNESVAFVRCVASPLESWTGERYSMTAEVVTDILTGLTWQRTGEDGLSQSAAAAECGTLSLAGLSGWRLPTREEALTLLDVSHVPAFNPSVFTPNTTSVWTSTFTGGQAWQVGFLPNSTPVDPGLMLGMLCVRDAF